MIKNILAAATLVALATGGAASAAPFQIETGDDATGNGSTSTGLINELGYSGTLATSIYFGDPAVAGTTVVDTNMETVMDSFGFATGNQTTIGGSTVNFSYPLDPSQKNIASLNPLNDAAANNGFTEGTQVAYGTSAPNEGVFWGLTYDYRVEGQTTGTGIEYNSGYFDLFYEDGTAREQVLRLNVTGSNLQQSNLDVFGQVSFDFNNDGTDDAAGNSFVQNFFYNPERDRTFYDIWSDTDAGLSTLAVNWILDTNVNPPVPDEDQLVALTNDDDETFLFRQTTLDGSVTFEVPEPLTLSLFGLGLVGLAFTLRRRRPGGMQA